VDGTALQGTYRTQTNENPHLAKVRVAGSNPVFRSIQAGQKRLFKPTNGLATEQNVAPRRFAAHAPAVRWMPIRHMAKSTPEDRLPSRQLSASTYRKETIHEVVAKLECRVVLDHQPFEVVSALIGVDHLAG
jgi:hypothetical protein